MPRPALEVSQVFSRYGDDYRKLHPLSPEQHKAMRDIESCRTARLGGHVDLCTCGYTAISYNSCRNRHCPKCQSLKQAKWLEERTDRLLPVRHFHLVVTLPHELVPLTLFNRKFLFNLFFETASRALLEFAAAYERLRAHIGFTAVLHTWDQDLNFHPHLHILATGGGLSVEGDRWVSSNDSFLLPVKALSKIIRAKVVAALNEAFKKGRLRGNVECLKSDLDFNRFLRQLRRKKWVIYCKRPFGGSHQAFRYISRYTHRVAISNHRLVNLHGDNLTFRARDNHNPGQQRLVTIQAEEFIRRFLLHILPPRFVKIRHFGLMAPSNAHTKLEKARALITAQDSAPVATPMVSDTSPQIKTWQETMRSLTGIDLSICPQCGKTNFVRLILTSQYGHTPPTWDSS